MQRSSSAPGIGNGSLSFQKGLLGLKSGMGPILRVLPDRLPRRKSLRFLRNYPRSPLTLRATAGLPRRTAYLP
jgi:hypothetical protein